MAPPKLDFSRRARPEGCLSDLALDRHLAGEPSARPAQAATDAHLLTCPLCTARLEELRRLATQPEPELAAGLSRLQKRAQRRVWARATQTLLVMAAALALLVVPLVRRPAPNDPNDSARQKGGASIIELGLVVRHANGHVEELEPGSLVRAGDAVRFLVSTARPGHIVVVGLDAAGKVSVYVADGDRGLRIERGRRQALPGSVILDDTPGAERVVALLCGESPAVLPIVDAAQKKLDAAGHDPRRSGELALPGCAETHWMMEKSTTP